MGRVPRRSRRAVRGQAGVRVAGGYRARPGPGMSRRVLVIGIGMGDPASLTLKAVAAINRADIFFLLDKGEASAELIHLREAILETHRAAPWRTATVPSPPRGPDQRPTPDCPRSPPTAVPWSSRPITPSGSTSSVSGSDGRGTGRAGIRCRCRCRRM